MNATSYTQPTRSAENRNMTTSTALGIPRRRMAGVAFLAAALLLVLPASIGAQVLVLSKLLVTVSESADDDDASADYTVQLNMQPTNPVTVTVRSTDPEAAKVLTGAGTLSGSVELSFNTRTGTDTGNWNVPQPVTVQGVDDEVANPGGGRFTTITHSSSGGGYTSSKTLYVAIQDDGEDAVGLDLNRVEVAVTEGGYCPETVCGEYSSATSMASYTVGLLSEPTDTVVVTVTSDTPTAATLSPKKLTFTSANWNDHQAVTVTGVNDGKDNTANRSATIMHTASGGNYDKEKSKVMVVVIDLVRSDAKTIEAPPVVTVKEGDMSSYNVVLNSPPENSVLITLQPPEEQKHIVTVAPGRLDFDRSNWEVPQKVTLESVDNKVASSNVEEVGIVHSPLGGGYMTPKIVTVRIIDDDTKKLGLKRTVDVTEGTTVDDYSVKLKSQPVDGDVRVTVSSDTGVATVTPDTLTFTSVNWETAQTVVITALDDEVDNPGDVRSTIITFSPSGGGYTDTGTDNQEEKVTVRVHDDGDKAALEITGFRSEISDDSLVGTFDYSVKLKSEPVDDVLVTLEISDTSVATVSSDTPLTFTSVNWEMPQVVTVDAKDIVDNYGSKRRVTITHSPSGGGYDGVSAVTKELTVTDDEDLTVTDEDGTVIKVKKLIISRPTLSIPESGGRVEGYGVPISYTIKADASETSMITVRLNCTCDSIIKITDEDPADAASDVLSDVLGALGSNLPPLSISVGETKTVWVIGENDEVDNAGNGRSAIITHTSSGYQSREVPVTVTDDGDTVGLKIDMNSITVEESSDVSFNVQLTSSPPKDFSIDLYVVSNDPIVATVTPKTPADGQPFTDADWKTPKTFTVTGEVDNSGDSRSTKITLVPVGPGYGSAQAKDVSIKVGDTDVGTLKGVPEGTFNVPEGKTPSYGVWLTKIPTAGKTVTVAITSSPRTTATVSPASLTFNTINWKTAQTVFVTGVFHSGSDDRSAKITHNVSGGGYNTHRKDLTVTVRNDDTKGLGVSSSQVTVAEGKTATYTVVLRGEPTDTVIVDVTSDKPTAATVRPKKLTFTVANWKNPQTVTVTGMNDTVIGDRIATIMHDSASSDSEYDDADNESANVQVTVTDDDATVTVEPTSVTVPEAGGTASYTMKLDGQPTRNVTMTVTSSSSVATVRPGSLTFTPSNWATPQTITVTGVDDSSPGGNRLVTITHEASGGGYDEVEVPSVSVTVTDDDGMTVAPTEVEVAEAGGTATYRVSLNTQPTGAVTVAVASSNTSIAINPTSLTFTTSNWATPQPVTVTGVDDQVNNGAGRSATITNTPSGAGYGTDQAQRVVVVVVDDDPAPTLEIRGGEATEDRAGTTTLLTFTVTKSGPTDQEVTVAYADAGTGTATAGTDYTAVAGSLTFKPAETSKTITVMVQGDDLSEPDETVVIALRSPSNATIAEGKGTATGTIVDDDASRLSIEAGAARVDEGETLIFTVTLDPPIDDQQVTVTVEVDAGGTATAGTDYKGVPEMLTFVAGDAAKTITVAVEDDTDYELNETVVIALRNPRPPGDVVIDEAGEAMVTIVDNDPQPMLSISGTSVAEGNDGTTSKLTFKVTKSGGTSMEATVAYADAGTGTATAGTDYTAVAAGTLTFAPNETSKTVTVVVKGDDETEGDETVVIRLSSPSKATIAEDKDTAAGTIIDDDTLPRVASDWLARFGRTAASDTLDAIARRLNDGVVAAAPSLTVAGHRATFAPEPIAQAAAGTAEPWEESRSRVLTLEELANGSSAEISFVDGLNVWGASGYNQFEMTPQGSYTMDGSLMSAILGVDHQGDGYVAGLALAYHGGGGDFSGIGRTEGSLGTNLYSVHPYARLTFGEAFHVGGSFGIGTGDLSITDKDGDALVETGVGMPVLAALDARLELSLAEAWILALQADGHFVQMVADEQLPRFTRVETNTHRLRLGVENSYTFLITDGVSLAPVLETGLRYDGGDVGETGLGFDIGGGLRLDATVVGLMVDARGHASLSNWGEGQEQAPMLRDWGLGGVIRWRPAGGGIGPEISLSPSYGGTLGAAAPSLNAEIGYRMAAFGGVFTPYSAAEFGNGHQSYRAGAHFEIGQGIALSAEGTRRQMSADAAQHYLTVQLRLLQ